MATHEVLILSLRSVGRRRPEPRAKGASDKRIGAAPLAGREASACPGLPGASLRAEYLEDADFRALVDRSLRGQAAPRGTAIVLREVVAGLMRDKSTPITPNDAMDFFHTIVPVSYADFALLDRRWRDQVDRLRVRLKRIGVEFPLATVFSGRDGVEWLIAALEGRC